MTELTARPEQTQSEKEDAKIHALAEIARRYPYLMAFHHNVQLYHDACTMMRKLRRFPAETRRLILRELNFLELDACERTITIPEFHRYLRALPPAAMFTLPHLYTMVLFPVEYVAAMWPLPARIMELDTSRTGAWVGLIWHHGHPQVAIPLRVLAPAGQQRIEAYLAQREQRIRNRLMDPSRRLSRQYASHLRAQLSRNLGPMVEHIREALKIESNGDLPGVRVLQRELAQRQYYYSLSTIAEAKQVIVRSILGSRSSIQDADLPALPRAD